MANYLVRQVLQYTSGLPRDVTVNDFTIQAAALSEDIGIAMVDFYNLEPDPGPGGTLASFLSGVISREVDACRMEVYGIPGGGGPLGPPISVTSWTLDPPDITAGMPQEVALCTSFAATGGSSAGANKGRIYLGPFTTNAMGGGFESRPAAQLIGIIANATQQLNAALQVLGGNLAVWSRKDGAVRPVVRGWVDNSFDSQRRRGLDPDARSSWTA